MKAEELVKKVIEKVKTFRTAKLNKYFHHLKDGDQTDKGYYSEIFRKVEHYPCYYYQFLACLSDDIKSKQAVEIGADRGASTIMLSLNGAKVYSVDFKDDWRYLTPQTKNIVKLLGDSADTSLFEGVDLKRTDLWLFDGEHTNGRVTLEYETYKNYFKKDSVLVFDDIDLYRGFWEKLGGDKFENRDIHGNNVGVIICD